MGYSRSWAAVKNGALDTICSACNLHPTGQRQEVPESGVVAAELPNGWYLVLYNRSELDDQLLAKLSTSSEVVSCFVEDHVMFSSASGSGERKQVWKVFHDCEKGRYHLGITGAAPAALADIQRRLTAEQDTAGGEKADVDYIYDIPAELAKALTSFRHDEDIQGAAGDVYHVLEADGGSKSLASRLRTTLKGSSKSSLVGLAVFATLFSPVLLVGALLFLPWVWTLRLVHKLTNKGKSRQ